MTRVLWIPLLLAVVAAAPPGRESLIGEAGPVNAAESRVVVKKDNGGEVTVTFDGKTAFLRAQPGASTLEGATPVQPAEIKAGDRLLCRGSLDDAGTTLAANRVVVMTKGDVESQRRKEQEDWQKRGLAGVVTALDAGTHEITLRTMHAGAAKPIVVEAGAPPTSFYRYAPASVRFADAKPSSFAEIAVGDQLRVLGNRNAEGTRLAAEKVVSGAFKVVRGTVTNVDAVNGTLSVREGARGPLVTVALGGDTVLRRLPAMMVMRLLRTSEGGSEGGTGAADGGAGTDGLPAAAATPAASGPAGSRSAPAGGPAAAAGPRGGAWARPADPDEALERLPAIAVKDVLKGDEIAILGPRQTTAAVVPAIKAAVWTMPQLPAGNGRGGRGTGGMGMGGADAFSDVLGMAGAGETSW